MSASTKDPYRYYRVEAAELLENLTRGVVALERGAAEEGTVASLLRLAHTLKGASQVVKQPQIAQVAHTVEDILSPYREDVALLPKERAAEMLRLLDQIGARLAALESPTPPGAGSAVAPVPADALETVRVEMEEVEGLLSNLAETGVELTGVQNEIASLEQSKQLAQLILRQAAGVEGNARVCSFAEELSGALGLLERRLGRAVERTSRELAQARERVERLRLLPVETIFPALARAARDAAAALTKQVEVETGGGDIRLDAGVLLLLRDSWLHLVRNAVAHGIEAPEARAACGKGPAGKIELRVARGGKMVTLVCRDDGRGIDLAAIRRAAVKQGVIPASKAETLALRDAIDLILKGGVSTTPAVTGISGRGIGLDVVRDTVTRLKGEISIDTIADRGTTVEIRVPVALASVPVLLVEAGGEVTAIPLDAVREVLGFRDSELVTGETGYSIAWQEHAVPFRMLAGILDREHAPVNGHAGRTAVIVGSAPVLAAVGVESLRGTGTVLVRALSPWAAAEPVIAGGSLDGEGNPLLVLDAAALVAAVQAGKAPRASPAPAPPAPILVVDDSLTTRMVEQGLLESAGHQVDTANSGEDALEKARTRPYSLFLVDIEMPGMDGFEFIRRTQDDPRLRDIPSILVSSRSSLEDRRRGEQAGARAYITKSEFDQAYLLESIRKLVGG